MLKTKIILCLTLVVLAPAAIFAVTPEQFNADTIQKLWPELWKMGTNETKVPTIDPLSEKQAAEELAGRWVMTSGALRMDKIVIALETNRQVTISGTKDGKAWAADGQWAVISNKMVLYVKSDNELPDFIFRIKGKTYIFDPSSETLMSELKREKSLIAPTQKSEHDQK